MARKGRIKIEDQILEEFRKGTPWKTIREKYSATASIYKAFNRFCPEAEAKISKSQAEIKALKNTLERMKQEKIQFIDEGIKLENTIQEKQVQLRDAEKKLQGIEKIIEDRKKALSEQTILEEKGISIPIIHAIATMDLKNREDLLTRMTTVEAYNKEKKSHQKLVANRQTLEKEIKKITGEKNNIKSKIKDLLSEVASENQKLDEAKLLARTYKETVEVVRSYLQKGYSTRDFKSLLGGLKAVEVKGKPELSISRLITGLQSMKTLNRISDEIEGKTSELTVLNTNISKAKGTLDGYQKYLIATLAETNQKTLNSLQVWEKGVENRLINVGKEYLGQISQLDEDVKTSFNNSEKNMKTYLEVMVLQTEDVTRKIQEASQVAKGITKYLDSETERVTNKLKNSIFVITQQFKDDMEEYNDLKDMIRDYEIIANDARSLIGILKVPEAIKKVPLSMISQLMSRIHTYTQVSFPDVGVFPSDNVRSGASFTFSSSTRYPLPALTLFLKEEFEKRALEAAKNEP